MDEEPVPRSGSRKTAKIVGACFALFCLLLAISVSRPRDPAGPVDVMADLERDPELREMFAALRTEYPADHRALEAALTAAAREGDPAATEREGFFFLQRFMAARMDAVASAPDAQLVSLTEAYLALARLLRDRDVALCARLATGFRPGQSSPPGALALVSRLGALQIRAARAGEDSLGPIRGPLSSADTAAWVSRMRAIDPAAAALVRSGSLRTAAAQQQCEAAVVAYQAAADLPDPVAANVTVALIRPAPTPR